jgi:hypothetical protein
VGLWFLGTLWKYHSSFKIHVCLNLHIIPFSAIISRFRMPDAKKKYNFIGGLLFNYHFRSMYSVEIVGE